MRGYAEATTVYNHFDLYLLWVLLATVHICGPMKDYDSHFVTTCCYAC